MSNVGSTGSVITDVVFGALPRIGTATSKLDDFVADHHVRFEPATDPDGTSFVAEVVPRWSELVLARNQVDRVIRDAERMFDHAATRKLAPGEAGFSAAALDAGRAAINHLELARTSLANSLRPEVTRPGGQHGRLEYLPLNETRRQLLAAAAQGQRMLDLHAGARPVPTAPVPPPALASAPRRPQLEPGTMPLPVVAAPAVEAAPTPMPAPVPAAPSTSAEPPADPGWARGVLADALPARPRHASEVQHPRPVLVGAPRLSSLKDEYAAVEQRFAGMLERLDLFSRRTSVDQLTGGAAGTFAHDVREARRASAELRQTWVEFHQQGAGAGSDAQGLQQAAQRVRNQIASVNGLVERVERAILQQDEARFPEAQGAVEGGSWF